MGRFSGNPDRTDPQEGHLERTSPNGYLEGGLSRDHLGSGDLPELEWVAVKELNLNYYIGETLLFTIYTHPGNFIQIPYQHPSRVYKP